MASDLNHLHNQYVADPTDDNRDTLLVAVTAYAISLCRKRSITAADAEEVAQDTVITCLSKLSQYDSTRSSFRTWAHRLTLDQVSIHRRKAEAHYKDVEALSAPAIEHKPATTCSRRIHDVRKAAGDNAELIDLILIHGDIAAAAHHLGITPLAAQRRLKRIGAKINLPERSKAVRKMP